MNPSPVPWKVAALKKERGYVANKKGHAQQERLEKAAAKKVPVKVVGDIAANVAALMRKPKEPAAVPAKCSTDGTNCTQQAEEGQPWVCLCCTFPNPQSIAVCTECETPR